MKDALNVAGRAISGASAMKKLSQTARVVHTPARTTYRSALLSFLLFSFLIFHHYRALLRDARSQRRGNPSSGSRLSAREKIWGIGWGRERIRGKAVLYARIQI